VRTDPAGPAPKRTFVGLREELNARREQVRVRGPAVWAPEIEDAPWGARVLTVADPFGNHLRFNEPDGPASRQGCPDGGLRSRLADPQSWTGRAASWMLEAPRRRGASAPAWYAGPR
jgi:Glyoxalase superfamily protein